MSWRHPNCDLHFTGWSAILVSAYVIVSGLTALAHVVSSIVGQ